MQRALAQEVFVLSKPKRNAYFFVAGLLNQQIALLQTAQILDGNGETCLRMPFALGDVFGVAAWTSDKHELARPSDDADELVLLAYEETLGPLPKEYISQLSGSASQWPEFHDGMELGARDAMQISQGITKEVTGLAQFIARCRPTSSSNPAGKYEI